MAQVLVMGLILVGLVVLFVDASGRPRAHLFPASRRARLRRLSSPKAKDCGLESRRPASTEVRSTIVQTDNAVVDRQGNMWRIVSQLLALRRARTSFHAEHTTPNRQRDLARNRRHSMPLDDSRWAARLRRSV